MSCSKDLQALHKVGKSKVFTVRQRRKAGHSTGFVSPSSHVATEGILLPVSTNPSKTCLDHDVSEVEDRLGSRSLIMYIIRGI